jgi:hypothetical protein
VEEATVGESGELVVVGHPPECGALLLELLDVRRELIDAGMQAGGRRLGPQLSVIRQCTARVGGGRFEDPHRPSSPDCGGPAGELSSRRRVIAERHSGIMAVARGACKISRRQLSR